MVNVGLNSADICDLDDRALHKNGNNITQSLADDTGALMNSVNVDDFDESAQYNQKYDILKCKNYPFYHKVQRSIYIMGQLLNDDNKLEQNPKNKWNSFTSVKYNPITKWAFENNPNAEAFRRSMLPFYLLKDDSGWQHPRYIEESNLSSKFCQKTSISVTVHFSKEFREGIDRAQDYIQQDLSDMAFGAVQRKNKKVLQILPIKIENFYLLQTAQALIEEILGRMYREYLSRQITKKKDGDNCEHLHPATVKKIWTYWGQNFSQLNILKFKTLEAYVYGETQLIYFSDVREHLKNNQEIELILINIQGESSGNIQVNLDYGPNEGSNQSRRTIHLLQQQNGQRGTVPNTGRKATNLQSNQSPLSIDQQMQRFPPIVNTLYMEKEIEYQNLKPNPKQFKFNTNDPSKDIELKMKQNLTSVYNSSSLFFWFPPKELLTSRTIEQKELNLRENVFPGNGLSYIMPTSQNDQKDKRMKLFSNKYGETNRQKAQWKSIRSDKNKDDFLKSNQINQNVTIKIKSIGNLIKMLTSLNAGNNSIIDIYEYHYTDTTYESVYGHNFDTQYYEELAQKVEESKASQTRRTNIPFYKKISKKQLKEMESYQKVSDRELTKYLGKCQQNYEKESKKIIPSIEKIELIQNNEKSFDFMNSSSNTNCQENIFKNQKFHVINVGKEKKKVTDEQNEKIPSTTKIVPSYIQVEAALFLGCKRISQYSYSTPKVFAQNIDFDDDVLTFYKYSELAQYSHSGAQIKKRTKLMISHLPSNTRVVFQIIMLPKTFSMMWTQRSLPKREGYIYGSVSMPLYDVHRRLKQGSVRLLPWPFYKFDQRYICMAEYYKVNNKKEVKNHFNSNLDIVIDLPRYHTDVYYDAILMSFELVQRCKANATKDFVDQTGSDIRQKTEFQRKTSQQLKQKEKDLKQKGVAQENEPPEKVDNTIENETKKIQQIKKLIQHYPLEKELPEYNTHIIQDYRHFVLNIAMYIRSIDFTDPDQAAMCYDFIDTSEQSKHTLAEDALIMLDAEFGDEKVRVFALTKLSRLSDTYLSLYIPQLVQALKYEVYHTSSLGEFLLERSLQNPGVVGHAFFWSLRAGIHDLRSYERFYLILERYLMCCGRYKYELFRQNTINKALIDVHKTIKQHIKKQNELKKKNKKEGMEFNDLDPVEQKKQIEIKLFEILKLQEFLTKLRQALVLEVNLQDMSLKNQTADISRRQFPNKSVSGFQQESFQDSMQASQQLQFGNHYIGHPFDIDAIEKCIQEQKADYNKASRIDKEKGLHVTIDDGLSERKVLWQNESIILPFLPKKLIKKFTKKSGIFLSKQVPLFLQAEVKNYEENEEEDHASQAALGGDVSQLKSQSEIIKLLFKYGDDLRQDNLVLQFFRIMDEIWMEKNMNMEMVIYRVLETGFKVGYIEFVDNSDVITTMHKWRGSMRGPFEEKCMYEYFKQEIYPKIFKTHLEEIQANANIDYKNEEVKKEEQTIQAMFKTDNQLEQMHQAYIMSIAGQCAATYTLGIRDRHSGNFMFNNVSGRFFHIDFGHFLNHCKTKLGFVRDREPFILSKEMFYLMINFQRLYKDYKMNENSTLTKHIPKPICNQVNGLDQNGNVKESTLNQETPQFLGEIKLSKEKVKERISISQRKLVRVYKWKEDLHSIYTNTDDTGKLQIWEEHVEIPSKQDHIILTDSENFIKQPIEILEGIHHLPNIRDLNQPYNKEILPNLMKNLQSSTEELEITSEEGQKFKKECGKAFQVLRERSYVFINLLQLMLVSDIEELQQKDIRYMIQAMFLDMGEEQAQEKFQELIRESLNGWYRKYDNWFHLYKDNSKGQK